MVQSWGVHRDFRGSARDSLAGRPSSREKHLENFSQFCLLSVLAASPNDLLATHFSREKRVFCISKRVFKIFSVFFLKFLWLFTVFPISLSTESDPDTPCHTSQSPFLHHSFNNLQETGMGFLCVTWFPHVLRTIFFLLSYHCRLRYTVRICFCLDCWVSVNLMPSLCVFQWLYTVILYIVTTLGHYWHMITHCLFLDIPIQLLGFSSLSICWH